MDLSAGADHFEPVDIDRFSIILQNTFDAKNDLSVGRRMTEKNVEARLGFCCRDLLRENSLRRP